MGEQTEISWCNHTFNPWWGCQRVSPACEYCYAETFSKRVGGSPWAKGAHWGPGSLRTVAVPKPWRDVERWNADAAREGVRRRVFCASMADVFEARDDLDELRARLWALIEATPALDWLLLTKRPEEMARRTPASWASGWPSNVWAGTTVEDQRRADERIPELLKIPARVRFLSCEPLLGPVNPGEYVDPNRTLDEATGRCNGVEWVIAGGESGSHARPMHPDWARLLRDQCAAAGVPFHFKQWGEYRAYSRDDYPTREAWLAEEAALQTSPDLRLHVWPDNAVSYRVGKHAAGRLLDGVQHDGVPHV